MFEPWTNPLPKNATANTTVNTTVFGRVSIVAICVALVAASCGSTADTATAEGTAGADSTVEVTEVEGTTAAPDADSSGETDTPETTTAANINEVLEDGLTSQDVETSIVVNFAGGEVDVAVDGEDAEGSVEIAQGTVVGVEVASDVEEEVHVHGNDIHADVGPDTNALIVFTADIPGTLEVELEESFTLLLNLQVS